MIRVIIEHVNLGGCATELARLQIMRLGPSRGGSQTKRPKDYSAQGVLHLPNGDISVQQWKASEVQHCELNAFGFVGQVLASLDPAARSCQFEGEPPCPNSDTVALGLIRQMLHGE
jgi:hypothetical protein